MNEANKLVPVEQTELDNADAMLASLTDIAYSTVQKKPTRVKRGYRSKFFFKLSKSFSAEVADKKKTFVPKQLVHIDAEVEKRLKSYKQQVPEELAANINKVREFFLQEIAPITMAAGAGASQAQEVVKRLVKSDIDGTQFEKFEHMMALAVNIKMARFVAKQMGLTKTEATEILTQLKPRVPQIVPIGVPSEVRQEDKKAKNVR